MHAFEDIAGLYREELRSLREDAGRCAVRKIDASDYAEWLRQGGAK